MPGSQTIEGLMSNLNTTSIVDSIMKLEHRPVDLLTERQAEATNQLTTYNSISALMVALGASTSMLNRSSAFSAASLSVSDDTMISAQSTGRVTVGTYSLSVTALAANHQIASQGYADPSSAVGTGSLQLAVGHASPATITLSGSNNTLSDLKNAINAAGVGVTASIINDGTSANPYRLLLSANATGAENLISYTSNLTGGATPNFSTATFDQVENVGVVSGTSVKTLGGTAAYTGSQNKSYTFTVAGTGTQTIGSGPITVNWSDGTNSGSISVTTAGEEVALTGTGSDGLKIAFGAGTLVAGDQFRVQTLSPLLQKAADAQVSLGSTAGGGSPIVISSASNQIDNLIGGVSLKLKGITTAPVVITANVDSDTIKANIKGMLDNYNQVMQAIDKQFSYNPDTQQAGALLGDEFLLSLQSGLRNSLTGAIDGLPKSLNMLRAIGITTGSDGLLTISNSSTLASALAANPDGVRDMFLDSGVSTNALISFISAGAKSVETNTGYAIKITEVATRMTRDGALMTDPGVLPLTLGSSNNTFRMTVDGFKSNDIALAAKTYASGAELASEIQQKLKADSIIGGRGVAVEWVTDSAETGHLRFTSGSYGSTATVTIDVPSSNSAVNDLGFGNGGTSIAGHNVAGTINGFAASGAGRTLTAGTNAGNAAGLSVEVRMTASDMLANPDAMITYHRGFAARLGRTVDSMTRSNDGQVARRTKGIQSQIDDLKAQIKDKEDYLAIRREKLYERFVALEQALSQFQAQGSFLSQQLAQLSANTSQITSR